MNAAEQWWIGGLAPSGAVLDLGPQHPTRAGLVRLDLTFEGDTVTTARVQPGYLHRAAEKLFEVRDYRAVLMLADRHDWQAPFSGELLTALACEQALGLSVPPRAVWLRTMLAEVTRMISHLGFCTWLPHHLGDAHLGARLRDVREAARQLMLALSGNRLHPMLNRLGGLATDASPAWLDDAVAWAREAARLPLADALAAAALRPGLGGLDAEQVDAVGLSGPIAAATGVRRDLRRTPGYLAYPELEWNDADPAVNVAGDVHSRFAVLIAQLAHSCDLVAQCRDRLAEIEGPVSVKLSKIIKVPESETVVTIEAPMGVAGVLLTSRGGTTPHRLALRTPTLANVNACQHALVGAHRDEVGAVIASLGWTIGDLDR